MGQYAGPSGDTWECSAVAPRRGAEEQVFLSNGVRLRFTDEGRGDPVILLHGIALGADRNWRESRVIADLSQEHRVIAIDCRGHGRSAKPHTPGAYGMAMVEDVVRLLDHLAIAKAHILGYAMGGRIALKLLATYPDRLLTATLGGSGGIREGADLDLFQRTADALQTNGTLGPFVVALQLTGEPHPSAQAVRDCSNALLAGNDARALASVLRAYPDLVVSDAILRGNGVPALALVGGLDPMRRDVERLAATMAALQVVVIEGADHRTAFARREFVRDLLRFLGQYPGH